MNSTLLTDYYESLLTNNHFILADENETFNSVGRCWKPSPKFGDGFYWIYAQKDLFDIKIHDFYFNDDFFMEFKLPECLSITQYESISGEELNPYRRLSTGCIKTFVGGYKPYKALIHKKIPIRSIGIEVMPSYYEDYLKKQYPIAYVSPLSAFKQIDQTMDFPAMAKLLYEVKNYQGSGIAASLFYEAKVAEAVSLVVQEQKKIIQNKEKQLMTQDIEKLENVVAYLNDHYAFDLPLKLLAKIACMGTTKLKVSFKQLQGCTITEYIQQRRMSQAESLLINTDFTIGQIAKMIGYSTSSRFAELFRKSTGILPMEYRKMAQRN
ncbi:helix-turn-helix transcriptional regulator [Clostridium tyrobutyricum]|uniref:helix-turn-helix transcriptional regulator n=1 Tax=Clostridium tyrobutyricum TaxID=1519 RepID=UPI001C392A28|nr:AraC family transcriptional regulator [Clostridium tyrobutyricum]MBV4429411.1 AraC family transcriptional regulator [Clostridium tyrobutyricum]MBV4444633.1 AraC family transcriptional regulator [Clostridium tyrobutyricum]